MKKNNNIMSRALEIFGKVFPNDVAKIKSIKDIHNGYTNYSFLITLDDKTQFQVRIPHSGELINRKNEHDILKITGHDHFVYFDDKTGVGIKKWIKGSNPSMHLAKRASFASKLFPLIKKIHKIPVSSNLKIEKIGISKFNKYLSTLPFEYQKKYLCLIERRRNDPLVLTHSDINPLNVIIDEENYVTLIDFEWSCLAPDYWDYANWVRETEFNYAKFDWHPYINNFSMETLRDYLFLTSTFAYLWTFAMPETKKILAYRKTTLKQLKKYYKGVLKHEQFYYC